VLVVWLPGPPRLDPVVAILAGINILWTGFGLVRNAVNGLMDASLPDEDLQKIKEVLDSYRSDDIEFHAVRTRVAGNRHFLNMHVLVPGVWSVKKGHDFTEEVIDSLIERLPDLRVQAHLEPKEDPKSYEDIGI
jgi:divalent metal cation (Fe/Co/Zn/Cd) transporter